MTSIQNNTTFIGIISSSVSSISAIDNCETVKIMIEFNNGKNIIIGESTTLYDGQNVVNRLIKGIENGKDIYICAFKYYMIGIEKYYL